MPVSPTSPIETPSGIARGFSKRVSKRCPPIPKGRAGLAFCLPWPCGQVYGCVFYAVSKANLRFGRNGQRSVAHPYQP